MKTNFKKSENNIFFILLTSFFVFLMNVSGFAAELGDANGDTQIDIVDALMVARYSVGLPAGNIIVENCDVDGNELINIVDALIIAQYYTKLITQFPASSKPTKTPVIVYPENWSQVKNFLDLDDTESQKLLQNRFIILNKNSTDTLTSAYIKIAQNQTVPAFITTDALLHVFHITYADMLIKAEKIMFIGKMRDLLLSFSTACRLQYAALNEGTLLKEAARRLWLFSEVANALINGHETLLGTGKEPVSVEANLFLSKISAHTVIEELPGLDYTLFTPRGHYTLEPEYEQYFQALKWLQLRKFVIQDQDEPLNGNYELAAAAIMAYILENNSDILLLWQDFYDFNSKLTGLVNNFTPIMVRDTMQNLFGSAGYAILEITENLDKLRAALDKIPDITKKNVQFIGEPYLMYVDVMEKTLNPQVSTRYKPSGLDMAATVLASDIALEAISTEFSTYPDLQSQLLEVRNEFLQRSVSNWTNSISNSWYYALRFLSEPVTAPAVPDFMRTSLWKKVKLNTQLASWSELHSNNVNLDTVPQVPTPTPQPTPPPVDMRIYYLCGESNPSANQISFHVNLKNYTPDNYTLANIKIRYYYSPDGAATQQYDIDYAVLGSSNITGDFHDGYFELGFTKGAGILVGGSETGRIQVRIHKTDWSNYNQSNDYSFAPSITLMRENPKLACYYVDSLFINPYLLCGNPPAGTATPTPTVSSPTPTSTSVPTTSIVPTLGPTPTPTPTPIPGFVEPYPEFFSRLQAMCAASKDALAGAKISLIHTSRFTIISSWLQQYNTFSQAIINGTALTPENNGAIHTWGKQLSNFFFDPEFVPETEAKAHVITDLYTCSNEILYAAMGKLFPIAIIYEIPGYPKPFAAVGYVLSYYEFALPTGTRISDEQWEKTLSESNPARPAWINELLVY